jgi:cbb3-type cytochrome oxidase maturation protein
MTTALIMLIVAAIVLALTGITALLWAMRSGQFDDPDGDARRILIDDDGRG